MSPLTKCALSVRVRMFYTKLTKRIRLTPYRRHIKLDLNYIERHFVERLTRDRLVVSSNPIRGYGHCFLAQEYPHSLLRTSWFQERIQA